MHPLRVSRDAHSYDHPRAAASVDTLAQAASARSVGKSPGVHNELPQGRFCHQLDADITSG